MRFPRPLIQRPRSPQARRYRQLGAIPTSEPWRAVRYAVVDLETTGLDARRHEIISWAVVPVDDGRIIAGDARYGLVRPRAMPEAGSIVVHGILPADLEAAPPPDAAIDELLDAVAGRVVVAHAAWFERSFLRRASARRGVRWRSPMIDTSVVGRLWLFERDGYLPRGISLRTLTRALGLPAHRPHHALGDALTTAQAFLAIATHLDAREPESAASLLTAGSRVDNIRRLEPPEGYPRPEWPRDEAARQAGSGSESPADASSSATTAT